MIIDNSKEGIVLDIKTVGAGVIKPAENSNPEPASQPLPRPSLEFPSIEPEKNFLGIFSIIALVIVLVAAIGLYIMKANKNSLLSTKTAEANGLIQQLNTPPLNSLNQQIIDLENGLGVFQSAMQGKVYYSKMFSELGRITPKNVRLTAFSMDETGAIKVSGEADDFSSVAKFVKSMQDSPDFSGVKLVSSTVSETVGTGKVTFSVTSKVNTNLLKETAIVNQPAGNMPAGTSATGTSAVPGSQSATGASTQTLPQQTSMPSSQP